MSALCSAADVCMLSCAVVDCLLLGCEGRRLRNFKLRVSRVRSSTGRLPLGSLEGGPIFG